MIESDTKTLSTLICILTSFFLLLLISAKVNAVQADTLLVNQDNGDIYLIYDHANNVLAASSDKKPAPTVPSGPTVQISPPSSKSVVTIAPPTTNTKKINVTITTAPTAAPGKTTGTTGGAATAPSPTAPLIKTVDRVMAEDQKGQVVLDVKPTGKNSLNISQGTSDVQTGLKVQINTSTHSLDVVTPTGVQKVSVLPSVVVDSLSSKGVIQNVTSGGVKPSVSLIQDKGGTIVYQVKSEKKGKLFGLVNVQWPVEVKVSAQTGKTVNIKQPILSTLFGIFVK